MLGLYLFAAIVGAGLLVFSLLGMGENGGHDHAALADAEHPGLGELVLAFLKPRNFIFGAAGFGITGTLLTLLGAGPLLTPLAAAGMGAAFFVVSHVVFTLLRRTETATDLVSDTQLMGERARVTLPLEPGHPGRVACQLAGREVYLTARQAPGASGRIPVGAEVVVIRVTNGVAEVATPDEYARQLPPEVVP